MLVIWCVWPRRGPYEPEFGGLSRGRPGSRQNRDKIRPGPRDLAAAHVPVFGAVRRACSAAAGPDPVDFGPCLGVCRTWPGRARTNDRCGRRMGPPSTCVGPEGAMRVDFVTDNGKRARSRRTGLQVLVWPLLLVACNSGDSGTGSDSRTGTETTAAEGSTSVPTTGDAGSTTDSDSYTTRSPRARRPATPAAARPPR